MRKEITQNGKEKYFKFMKQHINTVIKEIKTVKK